MMSTEASAHVVHAKYVLARIYATRLRAAHIYRVKAKPKPKRACRHATLSPALVPTPPIASSHAPAQHMHQAGPTRRVSSLCNECVCDVMNTLRVGITGCLGNACVHEAAYMRYIWGSSFGHIDLYTHACTPLSGWIVLTMFVRCLILGLRFDWQVQSRLIRICCIRTCAAR